MKFKSILDKFSIALLLIVIARVLIMPLYPLIDPTEGRYAELAHQMTTSGDWITPKVWIEGHLMPFLGKPPFAFWVEALCIKIFGVNEIAPRFASMLGALVAILAVWIVIKRYISRETAQTAVLIIITSGVFYVVSGFVGTDLILTGFVAVTYMAYYAWLKEERKWPCFAWSMIIFAGIGLMILTKGLVGVITFGMPIFCWHLLFGGWKRVLRRQAWIPGLILTALIAVPWFYLVQISMAERGIDFIRYFFVEEHFRRFTTSNYYDPYGTGHLVYRGGAIVYMLATCAPWTVLMFLFFWKIPKTERPFKREHNILWQNRDQAFFFLGFAVNTLFWCLGRQFLITYMIPFAIPFGVWFALRWQSRFPGKERLIQRLALTVGLLIAAGLAFYAIVLIDITGRRQNVKALILDNLPARDALRTDGKPWRFIVAEGSRRSSPYYYGAVSGRIVLDTQPGEFIPLYPKKASHPFPYYMCSPIQKIIQSDSRIRMADALRNYSWPEDILMLIEITSLNRMCNQKYVGYEALLEPEWMNAHKTLRWTFDANTGKTILEPSSSDSYPHIELFDSVGTWLFLRHVPDSTFKLMP